jgi:hypothetical protein
VKPPLFLIAGWTAVAACAAISGCSYLSARRGDAAFEAWRRAVPASLVVDLSRSGLSTGPLIQTCSTSHAEIFTLRVDRPVSDEGARRLLRGLCADLVVKDASGRTVAESRITDADVTVVEETGAIRLARVAPFATGEYALELAVTSPASAAAGTGQRLEASYELCGLERLPAVIARFVAVAALVVALGAGLGMAGATWVAITPRRTPAAGQPVPPDPANSTAR